MKKVVEVVSEKVVVNSLSPKQRTQRDMCPKREDNRTKAEDIELTRGQRRGTCREHKQLRLDLRLVL